MKGEETRTEYSALNIDAWGEWASNTSDSRVALFVLPYIGLVLLRLVLSSHVTLPVVFADELGYLGNARYLAGVAPLPDMRGTAFYHFGYSLFLVPIFWLVQEPHRVYQSVIVVNALLLSTLYFALYSLLRRIFDTPKKLAGVVAFITCCYPSFLLQSNLAWAENALIPGYAFFIVAFAVFLRWKSYGTAAMLGTLTGFLFTIHPRNLPVLPLVGVHLCFLVYRRVIPPLPALLSMGITGAIWWATDGLNVHLREIAWGGKGDFSALSLLTGLLSLSRMKAWVLVAVGQVLYLVFSTYGLFAVGVASLLLAVIKGKSPCLSPERRTETRSIMLLLLSTSLGVFLASCTLMAVAATRGDHWFYGRYNEEFLALYIAFALLMLSTSSLSNRYLSSRFRAGVVAVIGVLGVSVFVGHEPGMLSATRFVPVNVLGIYPGIAILGKFHVEALTLGVIGIFIALTQLFRRRFIYGAALLLGVFFVVTRVDYVRYFYPLQSRARERTTLASAVQTFDSKATVSYDMSFHNVFAYYSYQYLLPHVVFERFTSAQGETPKSPLVITGNKWQGASQLSARQIAREQAINLALWRVPEPGFARQALAPPVGTRQFVPAAQLSTATPVAAPTEFSQEIKTTTGDKVVKVDEKFLIPVTVKNTGTRVWTASGAKPVRLSYQWIDRNKKALGPSLRTHLPHDIAPGESFSLNAAIQAPPRGGNYILRVSLVEERVAWFHIRGGRSLDLLISILDR